MLPDTSAPNECVMINILIQFRKNEQKSSAIHYIQFSFFERSRMARMAK